MTKRLLFKILRYSGLPFLFRTLVQRNKVTFLLFHDIGAADAEKTFVYLAKRYNIISLDDFIRACRTQDAGAIPPAAMVITFDDGHAGNYDLLPLVRKMRIPVTIFLCAGIVNTNRHFWFNYKHPGVSKEELKRVSNRERIQLLAETGYSPLKEYPRPQALTKPQIVELKDHINFQAHTMLHPCLPRCTDEEARVEIIESKKVLENEYSLRINAIAYPNGDYSDRDIELSKEAGYQCGVTVDFGFNTVKTDLFRIKRLSVNDTGNLDELAVKASGVWAFFKTRNGRRQGFGWTDKVESGWGTSSFKMSKSYQ